MSSGTDLNALLAAMEPVLNPGSYVFASLSGNQQLDPALILASMREPEGQSVIVEQRVAQREGLCPLLACAWITLAVNSDLRAIGLTAAFSRALTEVGISCNVVAGAYHDHIFVPEQQAAEAMSALRRLQRESRGSIV